MGIYYLWDEQLRIDKNRRGENYWFAYITEILCKLGVGGKAVIAEELAAGAGRGEAGAGAGHGEVAAGAWRGEAGESAGAVRFGAGDVVFTGAGGLPCGVQPALREGLARGMTLIGFGTAGADDLFGIKTAGGLAQPDGEFSLAGYFKMREGMRRAYLPALDASQGREREPEQGLPVFSPVCACEPAGAEVVADFALEGGGRALPALLRQGNAFYFAFDLAQTLLASAQGKPVYKSEMGLSWTRIADARITPPDYDTTVAYGDYYAYIIQSILYTLGQPMLHRLPPRADGGVPDLMVYYGGDEDATPRVSDRASEIMHGRGLPYHINLMPAGAGADADAGGGVNGGGNGSGGSGGGGLWFATTLEEYDRIKSRGHELALHYDLTKCEFTRENFAEQYRAYLRQYGETSVSTVGHCLAHRGWVERGRYLESLGVLGDNVRCAEIAIEDINAFNLYGFAFGTSYPAFLYDDGAHGNRRLCFVDIPTTFYEPRVGGKYGDGPEKIRKCLDGAAYFGRMVEFFMHPHYISDAYGYDFRMSHAALDEAARYIEEKGWNVIHGTPDMVCKFWHGRDKSAVTNCVANGGSICCRVDCQAEGGVIVKFPITGESGAENSNANAGVATATETAPAPQASVDGQPAQAVVKEVDGLRWLMVPVTGIGGHILKIII